MQSALTPQLGSSAAHHQAYGAIYRTLQQQASLWSYLDVFRLLVIVCLVCVPLVFLFKKPKRAVVRGELAAAHQAGVRFLPENQGAPSMQIRCLLELTLRDSQMVESIFLYYTAPSGELKLHAGKATLLCGKFTSSMF
jgi:hypothetical protein